MSETETLEVEEGVAAVAAEPTAVRGGDERAQNT